MLGNKESNTTFFYLKLCGTKKSELPYFSVKQKNEDGEYAEVQKVTSVTGRLAGIKKDSYTFEGETINTFKMEIRDKDEAYILSLGYNMLTRNLLNSLAGCDSILNIELSVFVDKKSGYQRLYVLVDGQKTNWKYEQEYLKTLVEQVKNKKGEIVSTDTSELDTFFAGVIDKDIIPKLGVMDMLEHEPIPDIPAAMSAPLHASPTKEPVKQDEVSDMPF
jgi:hypothetical protein